MPVTRSASRASARTASQNRTNTQDSEGFDGEYDSDYDYEYSYSDDDQGAFEDESMVDADSQGSNKRSRDECDDSSMDDDSNDFTSENPNAPRDRSSNISTASFSRFGAWVV